jgi:hypothetical protein
VVCSYLFVSQLSIFCAGRNQEDCESVGYCFGDVEGFEGVCSKYPGHQDSNSCAAAAGMTLFIGVTLLPKQGYHSKPVKTYRTLAADVRLDMLIFSLTQMD